MSALSSNTSISSALNEETLLDETHGAIMYIIAVIIWYALGFGLILLNDAKAQPGRNESYRYVNISQTVNDLHEHETQNDLLLELKDKERRMKLWQIYYGTQENPPAIVQKDNESIDLIIKKLHELNEERRTLRQTLHAISIDQPDVLEDFDDADDESSHSYSMMHEKK
jgi:hypothetical protein